MSRRCTIWPAAWALVAGVVGCAGSSRAPVEPVSSAHSAALEPSCSPLPETAFQSDELAPSSESPSLPEARDRFATRRIIAEEATRSRFRGAPVDLDLKAADIRDVFRLLADVGKINIVVAGEVSGTVTMRLRHVPWDQAMDVIGRARGLAFERDGNVMLVRPSSATRQ